MMNILVKYNQCLQKRPLVTKMITSGALGGIGDVLCQYMEQKYKLSESKGWNWQRTSNFMMMGCFFSAPILHIHFSKLLPLIAPLQTRAHAFKKLFVDQLIVSPLFMIGWYMAISSLDGKPIKKSIEDLKLKFQPTMMAHWKVWPAVNYINFLFVPVHYQVLFANLISLFFNSYLSYMHNSYKVIPVEVREESFKLPTKQLVQTKIVAHPQRKISHQTQQLQPAI
eukprot:403340840